MSYILQDLSEPRRLDEQSQIKEFSLERELRTLNLGDAKTILDAGCGSGVLCRYFEDTYSHMTVHGCDISENSLEHGKGLSQKSTTKFYRHDLLQGPTTEKYDALVNRLVFHHLSNEQQKIMLKNFWSSLNPGGILCVIDLDGLFLNLGTTSTNLKHEISFLNSKFHGNLFSGRYLPSLISEHGFENVNWEVITMDFRGDSRVKEVSQWAARFENSIGFYKDILGSEEEARAFFKRYLEAASKDEVTLFYNKFVVTARRPF
jgi:cyclopropane fatty-acyl-phospholipid synthase-like methyltransferase